MRGLAGSVVPGSAESFQGYADSPEALTTLLTGTMARVPLSPVELLGTKKPSALGSAPRQSLSLM